MDPNEMNENDDEMKDNQSSLLKIVVNVLYHKLFI